MNHTLDAALRESAEWAEKTFGEPSIPAVTEHLRHELSELSEEPCSAEEMADVLMLMHRLAGLIGVDLAAAVKTKLEVNRHRVWGPPDDKGVRHHIEAAR